MSIASFVKVLFTCESAKGAGSKNVIKDALTTLDLDGQTLFKYAMDPFIVFGVKKFDMPSMSGGGIQYSSTDNLDIEIITRTLDDLASRKLTGNAARAAVTSMLAEFTESSAKYLARIIDKDLQAGFSAETYNKVHPGNQVPVFNVMLADKCTTEEEFEEINFPCLADIKYDGERNVAIVEGNDVKYFSRSGKFAEHMVGLFDEELLQIRNYLGYDFVLDGERMARNYIETVNAKKSGKDGEEAKKNMIFRAFFLMPLLDWKQQSTGITMEQNRNELGEVLAGLGCKKIILSATTIVRNYSEMMRELDRVTTPGFDAMPTAKRA
jgi:ATP-dependent DNA ligase